VSGEGDGFRQGANFFDPSFRAAQAEPKSRLYAKTLDSGFALARAPK